jgi:hypothetical protein
MLRELDHELRHPNGPTWPIDEYRPLLVYFTLANLSSIELTIPPSQS